MAYIKIRNNQQGAGSTVDGTSIAGSTETIIDVDLPILVTVTGVLPDFNVYVTGTDLTTGQICAITVDATAVITVGDIYNTFNAAVEAGLDDPYHIPTVSGIIDSTGASNAIETIITL
jgi:hypothetical protein